MTTSIHRNKPAAAGAFTLIELLVVIGIMAVLAALALPAFTGMGRGQSMRSAVAQVRSTLSLARQWAITRNEITYVVFPGASDVYSPASRVSMALRSYAVWAEKSGYISEWRYLPPGIFFDPNEPHPKDDPEQLGNFNLVRNADSIGNLYRKYSVCFPSNNSARVDMYAISFLPNGRLKQAGGVYISLFMREGWVDVNTNSGTVLSSTNKPGSTYKMFFELKPLTGQARVKES